MGSRKRTCIAVGGLLLAIVVSMWEIYTYRTAETKEMMQLHVAEYIRYSQKPLQKGKGQVITPYIDKPNTCRDLEEKEERLLCELQDHYMKYEIRLRIEGLKEQTTGTGDRSVSRYLRKSGESFTVVADYDRKTADALGIRVMQTKRHYTSRE